MPEENIVRLYISGVVQGVGMRQYVQRKARQFGVKGYVRNLADGRVECVARAEGQKIRELISVIENAPVGRVDNVESEELDRGLQFDDFTIKP